MEKLQPVTEFTAQDRLRLVKCCNSIVHNTDLAEDLAQDAIVKATEKQQQFEGRSQYIAWACSIAKNLSLEHFRRQREYASLKYADQVPAPSPTRDCLLHEQILKAVTSLPPKLREAVELRYYQGMNSSEMAEHLSISTEAVKSRIHRAHLYMRQRMVN